VFGEGLADDDEDEDENGELGGVWGVRAATGMALLCACMIQLGFLGRSELVV